ncbi:uncharacterized protein LOC119082924 [Bradysia coprophila]|uniref:uncharacterized protein LOC119082924 n=1 Tax=Bradysia coprophila TaxID=38358 RepID=UPI00187DB94F|nr:uncharacterized protein LOC119082924 [Bradysia coprophila]
MARKRKFEAATDSEESHSDDDTPSSGYTYSSHFDSKKPKTLRKDAKESEFTSVQQQDDIVDSDPEPQHICQTHIELVEIGISKNQPIVYKPERGNNWIGRSPDSQLIADSNFVSRKNHACLVFQPFVNKLHLKDCDSTNGIYVNDEMVSVVELNEGDLIGIGCSTDHHSINNPECVVLRVTQKVIHYPNEQSTKRPQPVEPITLSSSSEDELEAPINRTSTGKSFIVYLQYDSQPY